MKNSTPKARPINHAIPNAENDPAITWSIPLLIIRVNGVAVRLAAVA